ncbi:GNAT family N-acetyltransferase [Gracilibacillus xinjiangensis]|uniref:GNAT family N-acetyltransferase n=1 Tax=Gracilibacillus xinjiangensis TaxID=1193282 RepID=A0ABV8WVM0_9BACI
MIVELNKEDFYRCRNLLNRQAHLEPISVIDGINSGRVFVDDKQNPTTGMVWLGNNDGFFFIGNPCNEKFNHYLNPFIDQFIVGEAKKVNLNYIEAIGNSKEWNTTLKELFHMRNYRNWNQRVYIMKNYEYLDNLEPQMETEFTIRRMDKEILSASQITNNDELKAKILESWVTIEDFLQTGIGFCIMDDNQIVSFCFSNFVAGNVHCIAIETKKSYEGRKLAQKAAHAFVKECFNQKKLPYWECTESNKASISVAEKLGFKPYFHYIGFEFSLS